MNHRRYPAGFRIVVFVATVSPLVSLPFYWLLSGAGVDNQQTLLASIVLGHLFYALGEGVYRVCRAEASRTTAILNRLLGH